MNGGCTPSGRPAQTRPAPPASPAPPRSTGASVPPPARSTRASLLPPLPAAPPSGAPPLPGAAPPLPGVLPEPLSPAPAAPPLPVDLPLPPPTSPPPPAQAPANARAPIAIMAGCFMARPRSFKRKRDPTPPRHGADCMYFRLAGPGNPSIHQSVDAGRPSLVAMLFVEPAQIGAAKGTPFGRSQARTIQCLHG